MFFRIQGYINDAHAPEGEFIEQFKELLSIHRWGFTGKIYEITDEEDIDGYIREWSEQEEGQFVFFNDESVFGKLGLAALDLPEEE